MNLDPATIDNPWSAIVAVALIGFVAWSSWSGRRHAKATRATLEHEVRPNSGSSLRDSVNRIEAAQADHGHRLAALEAAAERRRGYLLWRR